MEPLVHLIIPPLVLLAFIPKLRKLIFSLLIFSVIMDLDVFIPGAFHRILFHNLLFVLIVVLIIYFIFGGIHSIISGYYLISHLILDLGAPGFSIFWPFYKNLVGIETVLLKTTTGVWTEKFGLVITPLSEFTNKINYSTYLSTTGTILAILVCLGIILYLNKEKLIKK